MATTAKTTNQEVLMKVYEMDSISNYVEGAQAAKIVASFTTEVCRLLDAYRLHNDYAEYMFSITCINSAGAEVTARLLVGAPQINAFYDSMLTRLGLPIAAGTDTDTVEVTELDDMVETDEAEELSKIFKMALTSNITRVKCTTGVTTISLPSKSAGALNAAVIALCQELAEEMDYTMDYAALQIK